MSGHELLDTAEQAFLSGDVVRARTLLADVASDPGAPSEQRVQALSDLAVVACATGAPREAETHLLAALAQSPAFGPALENLAAVCEANGDLVQAAHWAQRAARATPDVAVTWQLLGRIATARRRFDEAETALARAVALDPDDATARQLRSLERRRAASPPEPPEPPEPGTPIRRVLIVVDFFFPSVGGSERLAEAAGVALRAHGIAADVATRPLPQRMALEHRGLTIHEIDGDPVAGLQSLLAGGDYDGVLIFSAPLSWPLIAALRVPAPRPRIVAVPCVNVQNRSELRSQPDVLAEYARLVAGADVVGVSSRSGEDVRLCEELGLSGVYVPNATERVPPAAPSPTAGLAAEAPLLLMVANMWPEKNHVGLLDALRDEPGDWRLAIIGSPSPRAPEVADHVARLATADDRVRLLGPGAPDEVAAAMHDASLLLLPSLAEATPLVLLEAMSRGLPWIATPMCGAAHDHAGGLIVPLPLFGPAIRFLLEDDATRAALGEAGRAHWTSCYSWDVIGPRYARLLGGEPVGDLPAPTAAVAATEKIRAAFFDGRPAATQAAASPAAVSQLLGRRRLQARRVQDEVEARQVRL